MKTQLDQNEMLMFCPANEPRYPFKASGRNRPISAAFNNKINKGYYKTLELKFNKNSSPKE
jgi:hypothetical protein